MRSLPKDNWLGPVPVDTSNLTEKKVNFDESHLVINPLLVITESEIVCVRVVEKCGVL